MGADKAWKYQDAELEDAYKTFVKNKQDSDEEYKEDRNEWAR